MATALFMQMVTEMTRREVDQGTHRDADPQLSSDSGQTSFILDHTKEDPKSEMIRIGGTWSCRARN